MPQQAQKVDDNEGLEAAEAAVRVVTAVAASRCTAAAGPDPVAAGLRHRRRALLHLRDKRRAQQVDDEEGLEAAEAAVCVVAAVTASSCTAAAGPDPVAAGLRCRCRTLLCLRAPRPAPQPPASEAPPAVPTPDAANAAASASVLDVLLAQVRSVVLLYCGCLCRQTCRSSCSHEASMVDGIATLPVWGDPRELMGHGFTAESHGSSELVWEGAGEQRGDKVGGLVDRTDEQQGEAIRLGAWSWGPMAQIAGG